MASELRAMLNPNHFYAWTKPYYGVMHYTAGRGLNDRWASVVANGARAILQRHPPIGVRPYYMEEEVFESVEAAQSAALRWTTY